MGSHQGPWRGARRGQLYILSLYPFLLCFKSCTSGHSHLLQFLLKSEVDSAPGKASHIGTELVPLPWPPGRQRVPSSCRGTKRLCIHYRHLSEQIRSPPVTSHPTDSGFRSSGPEGPLAAGAGGQQEAKSNRLWCLVCFLAFNQSRFPVHGCCWTHSGWVFLPQTSLRTPRQTCPEVCDFRFCQVDSRYEPTRTFTNETRRQERELK